MQTQDNQRFKLKGQLNFLAKPFLKWNKLPRLHIVTLLPLIYMLKYAVNATSVVGYSTTRSVYGTKPIHCFFVAFRMAWINFSSQAVILDLDASYIHIGQDYVHTDLKVLLVTYGVLKPCEMGKFLKRYRHKRGNASLLLFLLHFSSAEG